MKQTITAIVFFLVLAVLLTSIVVDLSRSNLQENIHKTLKGS